MQVPHALLQHPLCLPRTVDRLRLAAFVSGPAWRLGIRPVMGFLLGIFLIKLQHRLI